MTSSINYHRAKQGEKIPPRRKKEIQKDGKCITLKTILDDGDTTLAVYIQKIKQILFIETEKKLSLIKKTYF